MTVMVCGMQIDDLNKFQYKRFDSEAAVRYFDYFSVRPNKSVNSGPLDCLVWSDILETQYCVLDNQCLVTLDRDGDKYAGCIPYCELSTLPYYFKLQEQYFNKVLGTPFKAYLQDYEGVEYLKSKGLLDDYEIIESQEIFDYIYSAEEHRTLVDGRYKSIIRNIHKFNNMYDGRWEYRTLGYENRKEIQAFIQSWKDDKITDEGTVNYGIDVSTSESLEIEIKGAVKILNNRNLMTKVKVGGIYIDGKLCACNLGSYNPREKMYIGEIAAAKRNVVGLYQKMEYEFLVHEYPYAEIYNVADDVSLVSIRKAKMNNKPIAFEKRYTIIQNYST